MMDIRLIAAVGRSGQLGLGDNLPWHDPEDLAWFKDQTMGGIVVAGWKTWRTLPDLPGRKLILDPALRNVAPRAVAERLAADNPGVPIWIAGGAKTYQRWLASGLIRRAVITLVDYNGDATAWMPSLWSEGFADG